MPRQKNAPLRGRPENPHRVEAPLQVILGHRCQEVQQGTDSDPARSAAAGPPARNRPRRFLLTPTDRGGGPGLSGPGLASVSARARACVCVCLRVGVGVSVCMCVCVYCFNETVCVCVRACFACCAYTRDAEWSNTHIRGLVKHT